MAAAWFLQKFQIPQKNGTNGAKRPFGPGGEACVQHCSATCGASRLATAQALGGFMISEPCPEIRHLLFEASSHDGTSGGRNGIELLEVVERLAHRVGLHRDVALGVDQHGAEAVEDGADRIDAVARRADADAERMAALVAIFGRLEEGVEVQSSALGGAPAGYIACTSIPACCFIQIDARARALDLAADGCRHREPFAVDLAEIFDRAVDRAVVLISSRHQVVDRRPAGRHSATAARL